MKIIKGKPSPAIKKIVDSLTPEDMDEAKKELEQEPVSEDLEAEIKSWLDEGLPNEEELVEHIKETACHFAKWQKEQDQSTIELAEDHAMLAGMEKMKENMMAKAIDAELYSDGMLTPIIKVNDKEKISDIKFGDKVKIIIIKNE